MFSEGSFEEDQYVSIISHNIAIFLFLKIEENVLYVLLFVHYPQTMTQKVFLLIEYLNILILG